MIRIGIVGGRLQGLEAVYLAKQAGFETALIDKDPLAPAAALVDEFHNVDLLKGGVMAEALLREFDLVLPAVENVATLVWLEETARKRNVPLALDLQAYGISASKIKSNCLFAERGIPMPQPWPECGFPVIVKPSDLSGSAGVVKATDEATLESVLAAIGSNAVVQKYLEGPSYSLEVIAHKGKGVGLQVTELHFDADYDCKRVLAGPNTGEGVTSQFYDLGERLAAALKLSGIMDIEVIDTGGQLEVLEIDARLPSQTPSAVYHSSGVNMLELLADYWISGKLPVFKNGRTGKKAVIYEHLKYEKGNLEIAGEHILGNARGLKVHKDKFAADILISNFELSPEDWVATAIFIDNGEKQVWEKRNRAIRALQQEFNVQNYSDPEPA